MKFVNQSLKKQYDKNNPDLSLRPDSSVELVIQMHEQIDRAKFDLIFLDQLNNSPT